MKKTIKPDGTVEVEGTSEEISDYDKKVGEKPKQDVKEQGEKKPGLLTDELRRFMEFDDWMKSNQPHWPRAQHSEFCQISVAMRGGWLCVIPPQCTCGADPRPVEYYKITCTLDSTDSDGVDTVVMPPFHVTSGVVHSRLTPCF